MCTCQCWYRYFCLAAAGFLLLRTIKFLLFSSSLKYLLEKKIEREHKLFINILQLWNLQQDPKNQVQRTFNNNLVIKFCCWRKKKANIDCRPHPSENYHRCPWLVKATNFRFQWSDKPAAGSRLLASYQQVDVVYIWNHYD